jgi:hypothetical protein
MNIAESKGEKTVEALSRRLLAQPFKGHSKRSNKEMQAALLRLNPHLSKIGDLKKGTPILVPEEFRLAENESVNPLREMARGLLQQSEDALTKFRAMLNERRAESAERTSRVKAWLKSAQAKELLRKTPELKKVFASAAAVAKGLPKEQAEAIAAHLKALGELQSQIKDIRAALPK